MKIPSRRKIKSANPWFILYGGTSEDGRGPGEYLGRTTLLYVAKEHLDKCISDPYSTGSVQIVCNTFHRSVVSEGGWNLALQDLVNYE
jgi:hypothetical protein